MPRHYKRNNPFFLALSLICLALPIFAQNERLNGEIADSFNRFDIVKFDSVALRSAQGSAPTLRFRAAGLDISIALTPHDMRAPNFRAENTGASGNTTVERTPVSTFIGTVKGNPNGVSRINILGTKIEGYFSVDDQRYFIEPAANYSTAATTGDHVVYRLEDSKRTDTFSCGSHLVEKIENGKAMTNPAMLDGPSTIKHVEIATEADLEYVNALGGVAQANNEILGVLNAIEGLYQSQTSLAISVTFQHTWTTPDPYAGANTEITVRNFQTFWNANYPLSTTPRDTAHLFSGKPNVLSQGWAFIGVICSNPGFAYGISGYISWEPGKFLLTAHELGHNLGGNHVDTGQNCGNTLMNPQISGSTPLTFCQYSTGEISTFVNNNGTCLTSLTACKLDFDGDSKADISVFRPGVGEWYYNKSANGGVEGFQFGSATDKLAPADYTGDGKTDIAFWRPSTGQWFILRSEDNAFYAFSFGAYGDVPVPADFDSDGRADATVFRPSVAAWFTLRSSDGAVTITPFGATGDVPVAADYDGDAKADIAIFRPSLGQWWLQRSTAGLFATSFGLSTDKVVPGDYTGDGKTDLAIWRPSNGQWFIIRSEENYTQVYGFSFGASGDVPAPGDYDGDGKTDPTVYRPTNNAWFELRSTSGVFITTFGSAGDTPVPSAFVR